MAGPETLWGLCGRGGMEGSPAPGVAGVDEGQLLPVEQILQQLSIVPEGGLVQQPANTHPLQSNLEATGVANPVGSGFFSSPDCKGPVDYFKWMETWIKFKDE